MVSSWSRLPAAEHRAFGQRSLVSFTKQFVMREAGASARPGCGVSPQPVHRLAAKCGLTLRSSGPPPAWHLAREAIQVIIRLAGQAPIRWCPLSSNVGPRRSAIAACKQCGGMSAPVAPCLDKSEHRAVTSEGRASQGHAPGARPRRPRQPIPADRPMSHLPSRGHAGYSVAACCRS